MSIVSHHITGSKCPHCGHLLDGATGISKDGYMPKVGDLSVCFYCGELMRFGIGLVLEKVADEVEFFLNGPPKIVGFVKQAQRVIKLKLKLQQSVKEMQNAGRQHR